MFFLPGVHALLPYLDHNLPLALTDNLWGPPGFPGRHPSRAARRCLPCGYSVDYLPSLREVSKGWSCHVRLTAWPQLGYGWVKHARVLQHALQYVHLACKRALQSEAKFATCNMQASSHVCGPAEPNAEGVTPPSRGCVYRCMSSTQHGMPGLLACMALQASNTPLAMTPYHLLHQTRPRTVTQPCYIKQPQHAPTAIANRSAQGLVPMHLTGRPSS